MHSRARTATVWTSSIILAALGVLIARAQQAPPPPVSSTRPPDNNEKGLRPLTPEEIPPNLNFYAMDPLYVPGTPLGWASERIRESLDRGVVAIAADGGQVYLSWRLLDTDPANVRFNVYRTTSAGDAKLNAAPVVATTDFVDVEAARHPGSGWRVAPVVNGRELPASPSDRWTGAALAGHKPSRCARTCAASIAWRSATSTAMAPTTSSSNIRPDPSTLAVRFRARTPTRSTATMAGRARLGRQVLFHVEGAGDTWASAAAERARLVGWRPAARAPQPRVDLQVEGGRTRTDRGGRPLARGNRDVASGTLRVYSTRLRAADRRVTLMQDPLYRNDVTHRAMGYPHVPLPGYYLGAAPARSRPAGRAGRRPLQ
jgi:Rhamnogalacturonan I lyases beta-sheet domain